MGIYTSNLQLPGYKEIKESPLPLLRDNKEHKAIETSEQMPADLKAGFGKYAGFRILPYKMQTHYHRSEEKCELKTIVLENDAMKAVFLPEYGGRLYSLYNKRMDREILSVNPVFQPANLALRNAWFSGGVEWNMAHFGHSYLTCAPVFFAKCVDDNGSEFLRMYEYERVKKLFYQIDFHLTDEETLVAYTKIVNIYPEKTPLYYWSNTAVSELNKARVFSESDDVIYVRPYMNEKGEMVNDFGYGQVPHLDGIEGDVSYPRNFQRSNEYFFQNKDNLEFPFEMVAYDDGGLFYEFSSNVLKYRKMFCWGTHNGGEKWQTYLSHNAEDRYVEVQAGLFPSQLHSELMDGNSSIEFMQMFGFTVVDDKRKLHDDYSGSKEYAKETVSQKHDADYLRSIEERCKNESYSNTIEILHEGNGWAALEMKRISASNKCVQIDLSKIKSMSFPESTISSEQSYWMSLLGDQDYTDINYDELTFMIDDYWLEHLDNAIIQSVFSKERDYETHVLNKAIILSEKFQYDLALNLLEVNMTPASSLMYLRTLGSLCIRCGKSGEAMNYYEVAYSKIRSVKTRFLKEDFVAEYLHMLKEYNEIDRIWDIYHELDSKEIMFTEEMKVPVGFAALKKEDWNYLDDLFSIEPERIKEGDNQLCELWFMRKALETGKDLDLVKSEYVPPKNIDFRML